MKKIIGTTAFLATLAISAKAQITAGTILAGGSIGYSQNQDKGTVGNNSNEEVLQDKKQFDVSPQAAYFVTKNLALGLNLNYSTRTRTQYLYFLGVPIGGGTQVSVVRTGEAEYRGHNLNVGPFARYYMFVSDKAAFFGQAGIGYQESHSEATTSLAIPGYTSSTTDASGYYGQISPGFAYFLNGKFALEMSLRGLVYQHVAGKDVIYEQGSLFTHTEKSTNSNVEFGFGLNSLLIGASFYLGRQ